MYGKPLFEMCCFHIGIARKLHSSEHFFPSFPFDRGGGRLKLFGQCPYIEPTHFKKGLPLGTRGEADCGEWLYGGWGEDLWCPNNSVLVARCGSGTLHDCPHNSSHGIKCCSLYALQ